ncbi:hypothetical protein AVEN_27963-1 [Araneus ventricosus]|uniref:Uncharacterized protein n=1 Tax=Araneus ventricosus TaxID=182803 RepID=A0A4Y2BHH2_ARAVE|nr:hypothetical protein AVEN_27963-1 [Araneus ventricosus]
MSVNLRPFRIIFSLENKKKFTSYSSGKYGGYCSLVTPCFVQPKTALQAYLYAVVHYRATESKSQVVSDEAVYVRTLCSKIHRWQFDLQEENACGLSLDNPKRLSTVSLP